MNNHFLSDKRHEFLVFSPSYAIKNSGATEYFQRENPLSYHCGLADYRPTPTIQLTELAKSINVGNIYMKDESSRLGMNAFKALGASFAINEILKSSQETEVFCTASAGNHGEAVAKFSERHGKEAIVFVPKNTSNSTIARISQYGAKVIKLETDYQETCEHAVEMSLINDWALIQDAAWADYEYIPSLIMTGYLTQMYELDKQIDMKAIDIVFLQVGVGSWAASIVWYLHYFHKDNMPKIILVEPNESCGMFTSLQAGTLTKPNGSFRTIMAGLNCGIPSTIAFDILKNTVSAVMKINDLATRRGMNTLGLAKVNSGPSGAAGFAALETIMTNHSYLNLREALGIDNHSKILVFNTEGATDNIQ